MSFFRPCIDLHEGKVKQIVGGSLSADGRARENFVADHPPSWYAGLFARDQLVGGHVIKLGPGNDDAAREALGAWPGGFQVGGGITPENACGWLEAGASHVIVTSALFDETGRFLPEVASAFVKRIGAGRLIIDLSCRRVGRVPVVTMNRWRTLTDMRVDHPTLDRLASYCDGFLVHAADVEGLCGGVDAELVELLGSWGKLPVTYAGGAATMDDVRMVAQLGGGRVDITVGSALDIFGGRGVAYRDLVSWNHREAGLRTEGDGGRVAP